MVFCDFFGVAEVFSVGYDGFLELRRVSGRRGFSSVVAEDFLRGDGGGRAGSEEGFSDKAGRRCPDGRRIGSGRPPAQHKSIAGGCLFPGA